MMVTHGCGVIKMVWGNNKTFFGTCGNFKFEIYTLTDIKSTRSLILPGLTKVDFIASINLTDNADILNGRTLAWSGTTDGAAANELTDASETFEEGLTGTQFSNTTDTAWGKAEFKDADELWTMKPDGSVRSTIIGTGKAYTFYSERIIQVVAQDANDNGTMIIFGR